MTKNEFMDLVGVNYVDEYEKAQLSQEGTTSDIISRQAAIDANSSFSRDHENDLISRQAAIELVMEYCPDDDGAVQCDGDIRELLDELENLPSAQPEEAKRIVGKSRGGMTLWYQCDMCNEPVDVQDDFCRGCGRRLIDE